MLSPSHHSESFNEAYPGLWVNEKAQRIRKKSEEVNAAG